MFSGSYKPEDVEILLQPIDFQFVDIDEKEKMIQSGENHYSELLSYESLPSQKYYDLYHESMDRNAVLVAQDIMRLAEQINNEKESVVLVSLARAGTPVGVLLKIALAKRYNNIAKHYSVSIVRDKGIDEAALTYIVKNNPGSKLYFVDGWTGKGVITRELVSSIEKYNARYGTSIEPTMCVLVDLCGMADMTGSYDDYLIPSSILNATVSGLISRSIIDPHTEDSSEFHKCYFYSEYKNSDLSNEFIEKMSSIFLDNNFEFDSNVVDYKEGKVLAKMNALSLLLHYVKKYNVQNINLIKPGIGEATRVLLRRTPDLVLIKNNSPDVKHIVYLANEKGVKIIVDPKLPYNAVSIIQNKNF